MKTLSTSTLITLHLDQVISLFNFETGVKTIGDFVKRTEMLAKQAYPLTFEENEDHPAYKFKGDMLEILGDIFFNIYSADTAVGLRDYVSVPVSEDYGVDGIGINVNNDKCAIQIKYKFNPLTQITYTELAKTDCAGRRIHNIPLDKNDTIFLFTTGNEITTACQKVLGKTVRVIDRKIIAGYVDNNQNFWIQAEELIMNTLDNLS